MPTHEPLETPSYTSPLLTNRHPNARHTAPTHIPLWPDACAYPRGQQVWAFADSEHVQKPSPSLHDWEEIQSRELLSTLGNAKERLSALSLALQDGQKHTVVRITPKREQEAWSRHIHRKDLRQAESPTRWAGGISLLNKSVKTGGGAHFFKREDGSKRNHLQCFLVWKNQQYILFGFNFLFIPNSFYILFMLKLYYKMLLKIFLL